MLQRVLAAHAIYALVLTMPPGLLAQLPDAPSAQQAEQSTAGPHDANSRFQKNSGFQNVLRQEWVAARVGPALPDAKEAGQAGASSSSVVPQQMAVLADPLEGQSFVPSAKGRFRRALSSSTAYLGEVPGSAPALQSACLTNACPVAPQEMCCWETTSPFAQYLTWPDAVPLTARDNLRSAIQGVIDPFNLLTIGGDAAIGVASAPHSPYGPGMRGFLKYSGVSLTEDMTGEFFGTYLVPSIMHQDPHYHREPFMPTRHRILHAFTQIFWTQSYTGRPMFNYANVVGGIATAVVSNTFVPGPNRQGFGNTAQRLGLAFAISPSGNLIEEFVPDLASHINLRIVIFQRILNTVTLEESGVQ
jgi:hypothetical protein